MPLRLTYTVTPQLSEDTAATNLVFGPIASDMNVIVDTMQNENSGRIKLAAGASCYLDTGTLTNALGFYLRMDNDCSVAINGNAPLTLYRASVKTGVKARLFFEGIVTSVMVTAPSDSPSYGLYVIWGDLVSGDTRTTALPPVTGAAQAILTQVIAGTAAPSNDQGNDGDSFIDTAALIIYGPKANGVWPTTGRSLKQEAQLFKGSGPPDLTQYPTASADDFYLDTDSDILYELAPSSGS